MRVYSLDDTPMKLQERLKIPPSSPNIMKTNVKEKKTLFPVNGLTKKGEQAEAQKSKKLEIHQFARQGYYQSEYDLHALNPYTRFKHKNDEKRAEQKTKQVEALQKTKKKRRSKYNSKNSVYNPKSASRDVGSKSARQKELGNSVMTRQRSEKLFSSQKGHKKPIDTQTFVSATRIRYSKQIVKEIDQQKIQEEKRQAQLDAVEGQQARRLEKIHMIERMKVQQKLDNLKKMQDICIEALAIGRSFC